MFRFSKASFSIFIHYILKLPRYLGRREIITNAEFHAKLKELFVTHNEIAQIFCLSPAHSPDNLFLGFVVDKALAVEESRIKSFNQTANSSPAKLIGLLYAKKASYLNVSLLDISESLPTSF